MCVFFFSLRKVLANMAQPHHPLGINLKLFSLYVALQCNEVLLYSYVCNFCHFKSPSLFLLKNSILCLSWETTEIMLSPSSSLFLVDCILKTNKLEFIEQTEQCRNLHI